MILKQLLKKVLFTPYSPWDEVRKFRDRFEIDPSTVLLNTARFRFDVPSRTVKPCVCIRRKSIIGCNFIFESDSGVINIGEHTYIGGGTNLISRMRINIGNNVLIAWGCTIYDHNSHSLNWFDRQEDIFQVYEDYSKTKNIIINKDWSTVKSSPIIIKDKVWVGFDTLILKGVTVGEGAIIGAKSVVTKDVEPWTMVAGNPARLVKRLRE